ncbi:hypothetical protein [Paenibacillus phytohabitans]|uniref:hypothetical protein n=1 Tax=Paenibacillus phytohabitans TaxID=2654978 RepID=UPI001FEBF7C8|nr:hypothetical protein [Paenibacillus phytohabitans]
MSVFIKNFSYTLTSNFVSFIVSTLLILVVPKLIGVQAYGYWQYYLFYSSYVGFFHFGWIDGIYLRYGGAKYKDLNKELFFSQFYMLFFSQLLISIIISIFSIVFIRDGDKIFIFQMIALCLISMNLRYMLLYILQSTNRIKENARITLIDRLLYCLIIVIFLSVGFRDYKSMIVADLIGKLISLFFSMYYCKEIVFRKISTFHLELKETYLNISVGIKLMIATIASTLILGVVRFGIERSWDVSTFGKVSLTLSISNLLMLFINALGIIMYPVLKRTDQKKLPHIYKMMRTFLTVFLLGLLLLYYPFRSVLNYWLPQYTDSLMYMAFVFPMCVYEGKMSLLINTYFKALREEKLMLIINLISLIVSIIITIFTTVVFRNLDLAVVSIVLLVAFKCILSEILLSRRLNISIGKDIILELFLTIVFIVTGYFLNSWSSIMLYIIAFIMYLIVKRKDIISTAENVKFFLKT